MNDVFDGRRILVTGGTRGIGLEVSRALARRGASVIVAARGRPALDAALGELEGGGHSGLVLDVSEPDAWAAALEAIDAGGALHGLVTAAGVLGPIGRLDEVSPQEFIDTIAINLIGTVLALHHTLPRLRATGGRAVTFSGGGATSPLARYDAYAVSKAGVVRLTENVAATGPVEVNCVAPGFVATRMHEGTLSAGPEASGRDYYERTRAQLEAGGFPAAEAADLVSFLLSEDARGISGRLLSAQWDPWRDPDFHARLRRDASLGTLRRIDDQFFARSGGG
jgi:NAD(P)-dependent dehydrogenase (short-subunit alcohol dehydrogenase family)